MEQVSIILYVVCGNGLFTSGGHYIILVGINENTIGIYDPYLYTGKFNTASRRAAGVTVSGNNVYVSTESFRKYANYRNFWIFSNDSENDKNVSTPSIPIAENINHTKYVATKSSNLNVRKNNDINSQQISQLKKGTKVNVVKVIGDWSQIDSPINGWVSSMYLSAVKCNLTQNNTNTKIESTQIQSESYKTGNYITTSNLHVRTGAGTKYTIKKYNQLTINARNQNKNFGNAYYNGYQKGVVCTVTKVDGDWGLTNSGWICLRYCKKI